MDRSIFSSMQSQLSPSPQAVDALRERLAQSDAPKRRPGRWIAAACAALALTAYPIWRAVRPAPAALHSYVLAEGGGIQIATTQGTLAAGVQTEEPAFDTGDPPAAVSSAGTVNAPFDSSTATPAPDQAPSGALVGEQVPVQEADAAAQEEAFAAYQGLMAYFDTTYGADAYPDWYGGAYLQGSILIVNVVQENVDEAYWMDLGNGDRMVGKEFYIQVQEWAGSQAIGFGDVKYSLSYLRALQRQIEALPELELSSWACGVNEMSGQVWLNVPEADDALLAALARLDPEDDAIQVKTGVHISTTSVERPDPPQPLDGDPAGYQP